MIRVEDKYMLDPAEVCSLRARLCEAMEFDSAGQNGEYQISSVYFDDLWDTCLNDVVSGNPLRKKYRIRIYNNSFRTIKLEIKRKVYSRIDKISASITREELERLLCGEPIRTVGDPNPVVAEFNRQILRARLVPKVIVTYERQAFVCAAGNVRITIGRNIRGCTETERFGDPTLLHDATEIDAVLEVKYDEFIPDYILQLLETNRMQQTSCSKYRSCRELFRF